MSFEVFAPHAVDSYKCAHWAMYTPGTEVVYSNFTPRSTKNFLNSIKSPNARIRYDDKIVFFGLQGALMEINSIFEKTFFGRPKEEVLKKISTRLATFAGGMTVTVDHWAELHELGYLPIVVRALEEGTKVKANVPVFTIHNTNPKFYWIVNYLETWLSNEIWKPCTEATIAALYRNILREYAVQTGSPKGFINWQGHDFSCRGMSGMKDAAKSGAGHLCSFTGTDTISAVDFIDWAYPSPTNSLVGGSVPATEHSIACLEGPEGEFELFKRLITETVPTGVVSLVSDGFDYWNVLTDYIPRLKKKILARQPDSLGMAKVVIRPDSGDPVDIICGTLWDVPDLSKAPYNCQNAEDCRDTCEILAKDVAIYDGMLNDEIVIKYKYEGRYYACVVELTWSDTGVYDYPITEKYTLIDTQAKKQERFEPTPEELGSVEVLWQTFGGSFTQKGYKVLDDRIGLIYGDSITIDRMETILNRLAHKRFASSNIVFGIGSYTYQMVTRDTFGFAMKATHAVVNGRARDIFKDPKTDNGAKTSARGKLIVKNGELIQQADVPLDKTTDHGDLKIVFVDGNFVKLQSIDTIRVKLHPDFNEM